MTSSSCACRTVALRIFVRSLVGPAPSRTATATTALLRARASHVARAAAPTQTRAFATALPVQWRTALRPELRLGLAPAPASAIRTIHASPRRAADEPSQPEAEADTDAVATTPVDRPSAPLAETPPSTPGKNRRKKQRRRREAEAQAERILKEEGLLAVSAITSTDSASTSTSTSTPTPMPISTPTPASAPTSTTTNARKQRKLLRATRRNELREAALKEELADKILSKKQRQARAKERAAKQALDAETTKTQGAEQTKTDAALAAARAQRRLEKKQRGKAERYALLKQNDPAKYAEFEARRVKTAMKKERKALRLEKKRQMEAASRSLRGLRSKEREKKGKERTEEKDRKEKKGEKDKRPAWQVQKEALRQKFPDGWRPRKKLSPDALEGIRALNRQLPETYTTAVLASHFAISPEAVRRILKSRWQATPEVEEERQMRWFERGKKVWTRWAALGKKPPKQWQREGILRDASWTGSRRRAQEAREQEEGGAQPQEKRPIRGQSRGGREDRGQGGGEDRGRGDWGERPQRSGGGREDRGDRRDRGEKRERPHSSQGGNRQRGDRGRSGGKREWGVVRPRGRSSRDKGDKGDATFPSEW